MRNLIDLFENRLDELTIKLGGGSDNADSPARHFLKDVDDATHPHPFDRHSRLHGNVSLTLSLSVDDRQNGVRINDIRSLDPQKGYARDTMQGLCETADEHRVFLELTAKAYADIGMTTPQLRDWYARFGFVVDGEYGGDDDEGYDMVRQPQS